MRFGGVQRLLGTKALNQLRQSHALVVGVGGVGSWTAEALARSGIGEITLVDFDDICISNTNRQIQATSENVGELKIKSLSQRLQSINPELKCRLINTAFDADTADEILNTSPHVVIDAIDRAQNKCLLISECKKRHIPLVVTGAAGGRKRPDLIRVCDLSEVQYDSLLARVRRILRQKFNFPQASKSKRSSYFNILAVASFETVTDHTHDPEQNGQPKPQGPLDCGSSYGTAAYVTGIFGLMSCAVAVELMLSPLSSYDKNKWGNPSI